MSALADLFSDGDFRFHLTLRRGEPREFFAPCDASGRVLAERTRWLATAPERYAAVLPEGEKLLAEFAEMLGGPVGDVGALGASTEPDFLLLSPDAAGAFVLRGGALCFPTGWALEEKIGRPMEFIHGPVPGLNAALASPINQMLARLKPGVAFLRDNWGLAATDELNLHPTRGLPAPALPVALDRLWLRIEHQALVALPRVGGVVFGIRIELVRLDVVAADRSAAEKLRRELATMPAAVARYKRIETIRAELIAQL